MNKLLQTYGTGASDDEAFQAAIGMTLDGFDKAWLTSLKVTSTPTYGPLPAPPGPVPSDWLGATGSSGPTASPVESSAAQAPTGASSSPAAASQQPTTPAKNSSTAEVLLIAAVLVGAGLVLLGLALAIYRRETRPRAG
jgi:hypothetical protein